MEEKKMISAYIVDNGMKMLLKSNEDIFKIDTINYAFGRIKKGKVEVSHLKNTNKLRILKTINPKLKTLLSIGGWGARGFSKAASSSQNRCRFTESILNLFRTNKEMDGIDIDWEYPCSSVAGIDASFEDKHNYTLLLKDIREGLNKLGTEFKKYYFLTIAAGAGKYFTENTEPYLFVKYIDFVNVMTYDMRGSFTKITGHHTNLFSQNGDLKGPSVQKAVDIFNASGIPLNKIVIGAAFYGRAWTGVKNENNGLNQKATSYGTKTYSYSILVKEFINKNGFKRYWDETAKAPYLFNGNTFISYDDDESISCKVKYAKLRKLAGLMFWEYSLDNTYTLLNSVFTSFHNELTGSLEKD